jgi:hypothetical protein
VLLHSEADLRLVTVHLFNSVVFVHPEDGEDAPALLLDTLVLRHVLYGLVVADELLSSL